MKLWTVTADYSAVGEGRTLMAMVLQDEYESNARQTFADEFGDFFASGATVTEGVNINDPILVGLFNAALLERLEEVEGRGNVFLSGSFHVNLS